MDNSPLNDLPAELRNEIYGYVLEGPRPITIQVESWRVKNKSRKHLKSALNLLSTCRQIREEGLPILLSGNKIILESSLSGNSDFDQDKHQLSTITKNAREWIRRFGVHGKHLKHIELTPCDWFAFDSVDDYLCDFYPFAIRHLRSLFKCTQANPTLLVQFQCDEEGLTSDLTLALKDKEPAIEAVQGAQKELDSTIDHFCAHMPQAGLAIEQVEKSRKVLQKLLSSLESS